MQTHKKCICICRIDLLQKMKTLKNIEKEYSYRMNYSEWQLVF